MDDADAFKTTGYCVCGRHWNMCRHIVLCVPILVMYAVPSSWHPESVFICLASETCHVLLSDNLNCLASSTLLNVLTFKPSVWLLCTPILSPSLRAPTAHTAQTISCQWTFSILPSILALERFGVDYWTDSMNSDGSILRNKENIRDLAEIWPQDLLNTSQTLLSHSNPDSPSSI